MCLCVSVIYQERESWTHGKISFEGYKQGCIVYSVWFANVSQATWASRRRRCLRAENIWEGE